MTAIAGGIQFFTGNFRDLMMFHRARQKVRPVPRQPKPYFMLRLKLIEEASAKYLVGQLTSATK